ncbi:MAG: ABC transporter permease [Eubacteriales bacterium]|nr:ABC transporter permease [Eubacteriales bacterium]
MIALVKMNIRLLLRNKGFLFFLLVPPIVSAFILNIQAEFQTIKKGSNEYVIVERESQRDKAIYGGDPTSFIIKVYDGSKTELSEYMLKQMAATGMFSVCRYDVTEMSEQEIEEQARYDAFNDRSGALLYLKADFDQAILNADYDAAMQIYDVSDDERQELFDQELTSVLTRIAQVQQMVGEDTDAILEVLDNIQAEMPDKEVSVVATGKQKNLTTKQMSQKSLMGYALSIITLGFLFCGVSVAHTCIEEKNNKVYTRILLTKKSERDYVLSKIIVTLLIAVMQTFVVMGCLMFSHNMDLGIGYGDLLVIILLIGIIFATLSLVTGMLMGDVMNSNYAVFSIWSISALLAGMYFPIDDTSAFIHALSNLMPQYWFLNASEMLIVGDNGAYSMLLYVTVAYLIVIISLGCVGLKLQKQEN